MKKILIIIFVALSLKATSQEKLNITCDILENFSLVEENIEQRSKTYLNDSRVSFSITVTANIKTYGDLKIASKAFMKSYSKNMKNYDLIIDNPQYKINNRAYIYKSYSFEHNGYNMLAYQLQTVVNKQTVTFLFIGKRNVLETDKEKYLGMMNTVEYEAFNISSE